MRRIGALSMIMLALALSALAVEPTQDAGKAELKLWQGLWQTSPGGMQHQNGRQVVANPVPHGPCFFVVGERLIWLDEEGRPTGEEETIALDVQSNPKRVTFTPVGDSDKSRRKQGIYEATGASLTVHLGIDGGAAPRSFLELNNPLEGNDGKEWIIGRKKLQD